VGGTWKNPRTSAGLSAMSQALEEWVIDNRLDWPDVDVVGSGDANGTCLYAAPLHEKSLLKCDFIVVGERAIRARSGLTQFVI